LLEQAGEIVQANHHGRDMLIVGVPIRIRCESCGQVWWNKALPIGNGLAELIGIAAPGPRADDLGHGLSQMEPEAVA
jgi:hypothetical protein